MEFYMASIGQLCKWLVDCIYYEMQVTNSNRVFEPEDLKKMYPLGCMVTASDWAEIDFNTFVDYFLSTDYSEWVVQGETFYLDFLEENDTAKYGSFFMFYRESTREKYIPIPYVMP